MEMDIVILTRIIFKRLLLRVVEVLEVRLSILMGTPLLYKLVAEVMALRPTISCLLIDHYAPYVVYKKESQSHEEQYNANG
jgi:hypothetical protein